jgi:hypothetical protein
VWWDLIWFHARAQRTRLLSQVRESDALAAA